MLQRAILLALLLSLPGCLLPLTLAGIGTSAVLTVEEELEN